MKLILRLSILILLVTTSIEAQQNLDSIFTVAIKHARLKEYTKSINAANVVIKNDSQRYDVKLFAANVYAWQGNYSEAKLLIKEVYLNDSTNQELYDIWLNVLFWNQEYKELLRTIEIAKQNHYKNSYNLALKEAMAHKGMAGYTKAIELLDGTPELLDSADIAPLYQKLHILSKQKHISFYYSLDLFENNIPKPQHLTYIEYGHKIKSNTFILRCNYTYRFELNDIQPELDLYHVFKNNHYLYANYGFGINNTLFPRHRLGLEYYFPLGNGFEASGGMRLLFFNTTDVYIITGMLAKYHSNLWLAIRPYYAIKEGGNTLSTIATARFYNPNTISYWGVELTYGNSPDDRYSSSRFNTSNWLNAYQVKIEKNTLLTKLTELKIGTAFAYEEIQQDNYRNRFLFEILLKQRF